MKVGEFVLWNRKTVVLVLSFYDSGKEIMWLVENQNNNDRFWTNGRALAPLEGSGVTVQGRLF